MNVSSDYIEELFSEEQSDDKITSGSKRIFEEKLSLLTTNYMKQGCRTSEAEKKAQLDLSKYQTRLLCMTIRTLSEKYTKMVTFYKRAKYTLIGVISALFLCCLFFTSDNMSNKSAWILIWVIVVIISAGIMLTMHYLRHEYRSSILRLLADSDVSKESLSMLGIDIDDGDEEIFDRDDENEESGE